MKERRKMKEETSEILSDFKDMLMSHQIANNKRHEDEKAANDKRHKETSSIMRELTKAVTELLVVTAEAKKDHEHSTAISTRLEVNQIDLGKKVSTLASDMIEVKIKQKNTEASSNRYADTVHKVMTAVLTVAVLAYLGLKA